MLLKQQVHFQLYSDLYPFVSMQPAVCTRELCVFSFYTLGVMSGAAEEVATGAEVKKKSKIASKTFPFLSIKQLLFLILKVFNSKYIYF